MISGHGIPLELLQEIQLHMTSFFDMPLDVKEKTSTLLGLGYMGEGTETNVVATPKESTVLDQKESLNMNLPVKYEVWPKDFPILNQTCQKYYAMVSDLLNKLMNIFAVT